MALEGARWRRHRANGRVSHVSHVCVRCTSHFYRKYYYFRFVRLALFFFFFPFALALALAFPFPLAWPLRTLDA
jgi:hypothetical protein